MIRRTTREWERIAYGSGDSGIPETQAERLAAVARGVMFSSGRGARRIERGRKSLRARGIAGVIATPDCQLVILPKIEGAGETEVSDFSLRSRLAHMLAVVHDLPRPPLRRGRRPMGTRPLDGHQAQLLGSVTGNPGRAATSEAVAAALGRRPSRDSSMRTLSA